jgi:hypothetical protein
MEVKVGRTWQPYNKSVSTQWLRTALRVLSLLENGSLAGFRNVVLHPPPPKKKSEAAKVQKKQIMSVDHTTSSQPYRPTVELSQHQTPAFRRQILHMIITWTKTHIKFDIRTAERIWLPP